MSRHNKVYRRGTVHGWHVASLDGTEVLRTEVPLPGLSDLRHRDGRAEFVYRVSVLQTVGWGVSVLWGMESKRHEQEAVASLRLLGQTHAHHHHFTDVVTLDAHYTQAPVMGEMRQLGFQAVIRLKDECVRDARLGAAPGSAGSRLFRDGDRHQAPGGEALGHARPDELGRAARAHLGRLRRRRAGLNRDQGEPALGVPSPSVPEGGDYLDAGRGQRLGSAGDRLGSMGVKNEGIRELVEDVSFPDARAPKEDPDGPGVSCRGLRPQEEGYAPFPQKR